MTLSKQYRQDLLQLLSITGIHNACKFLNVIKGTIAQNVR